MTLTSELNGNPRICKVSLRRVLRSYLVVPFGRYVKVPSTVAMYSEDSTKSGLIFVHEGLHEQKLKSSSWGYIPRRLAKGFELER